MGEVDAGMGAPEPGRGPSPAAHPGIRSTGPGMGAISPARRWSKSSGTFTRLIGLDRRSSMTDPDATKAAVAAIVAGRTADAWMAIFDGHDVCVNIESVAEAKADRISGAGLFREAPAGGTTLAPLPPPFAPALRRDRRNIGFPALGEANDMLETGS